VRTSDGLALSSRNRFLNREERTEAACLFQVLSKIKLEIETGNKNLEELQNTARETLISRGWDVDYISLRQGNTLAPAQVNSGPLVVLGAAKLGTTRLIDNLEISVEI
jgi:pantoate--beta-alanine ligase